MADDLCKDDWKRYMPIPFWSWNDRLNVTQLNKQIQWMRDNDFGGFIMHARGGLQTEYMSEEWYQYIENCSNKAEKLGMEAWIYDENGWPSGFVGGKLLEDIEMRDMYICCEIGEYDNEADLKYYLTDEELFLTDRKLEGQGEYLNLYLKRSTSSADILNPKVVERFLEETHERYSEYYGENFAKHIKGFFTDEPQYYRWRTPYTPMAATYYREAYKEDIFEKLGLLFVEKKGYRQFRYRYWLMMQKLLLNNYSKRVYEWCEEHGVQFTGHYVEEVSMGFQIMCCGGVMPFYEYEHMPGIDWLGIITDNELAPRQVGSAARQLGKKQILTETFGCCGWDVAPDELRRIAGFQYACGVNRICHHLVPYSERGQRKRDYPAHFHPVNPWVEEHMKEFNDYFSKLGYLLGEGNEPIQVAVLHPIRSAYFDYKRGVEDYENGFQIQEFDDKFLKQCREISARGIGYHFLDETLLEKHGFVEEKRIGCGKCTYQYLILPSIKTMGEHTEKLLRKYVESGGKILLLDSKPQYIEGHRYDYPYLYSNCTMEEIQKAQPFYMRETNTELYCTYREFGEHRFIYVQNGSRKKTYTQEFVFSDGTKSFLELDLMTMQWNAVELEVTFKENEAKLLFLSDEKIVPKKKPFEFEWNFKEAEVSFERNYMTIEKVRYSKDGENFSKPIPTRVLFRQMLQEQYKGRLWLAYDFDIDIMPEYLELLAEKEQYREYTINGEDITFSKPTVTEPSLWRADITSVVRKGTNRFQVQIDWYQTEKTYYALFGENITENLRNCVTYNSEIEAVYLVGKFGVYSKNGFEINDEESVCAEEFVIGEIPRYVSELTTEGFPFFRGKITLKQNVRFERTDILLNVKGRYTAAEVRVNQELAGTILFGTRLDISSYVKLGENEIEITFIIGNRNLLGPFHYKEKEEWIGPHTFEEQTIKDKFYRFYTEEEKI